MNYYSTCKKRKKKKFRPNYALSTTTASLTDNKMHIKKSVNKASLAPDVR